MHAFVLAAPQSCHGRFGFLPCSRETLGLFMEGDDLVTTAARLDIDALARRHFGVFDRIGNEITISDDDRRRVLLLSEQEWSAWAQVRDGGPVPAEPEVPIMLRRLGTATHRLTRIAERASAG